MQDDETSLELLKNFLCMYWWDLSYMVICSCTGHWKGGYVAFYLVQRQAGETEAALKWLWVASICHARSHSLAWQSWN